MSWPFVWCKAGGLVSFFCMTSFSNIIYWRDYLFAIVCSFLLCINCPYMCVFISELSVLFHWFVCHFDSTVLFWLLWLCNIIWNQSEWYFSFVSPSGLLWLFGALCGSIQISGFFCSSVSVKNVIGILIGLALTVDCFRCFRWYGHLKMLNSSNLWAQISLHFFVLCSVSFNNAFSFQWKMIFHLAG